MFAALRCIDDRSMFVAASARSFLVKYAIKSYQTASSADNHAHPKMPVDVASMTERLEEVVQTEVLLLDDISRQRIAVSDVVRMLLGADGVWGLKLVQETRLFAGCLQQMKTSDVTVCEKLVDVLRELGKNKKLVVSRHANLDKLVKSNPFGWGCVAVLQL